MKINFYHLTQSPVGKALPRLLEKVLAAGMRCVVLLEDEDKVEKLNNELWTYTTKVFLPHGSSVDGYASEQPIYLTSKNENPNKADVLTIIGNAEPASLTNYKKCLYMFDGNEERQLQIARSRWKTYKEQGFELIYWQQTDKGNWEQGGK